MRRHSRRYEESLALIDRKKKYEIPEAVNLIKKGKGCKFDETVELVAWLGVDPKKADQQVRGSFSLPHGIGKGRKVIAFAEGKKAEEAKAAGADEVGSAELAKKIEEGWTDFDIAIASPDMMRFVGKLGRVLGPQGKMPTPKNGTVTADIATAVREFKAGKIEFRVDDGANLHAAVGKRSFDEKKLVDNISAFFEHIKALKPASAKGMYIRKLVLTTTMGPSVQVLAE